MNRQAGKEALKQIIKLDRRYELNECYGEKGITENFEVFAGMIPALVSAPHAVKQWRNGRVKAQDGFTGGIVEYLVKRFELYGITRLCFENDDPNFGDDERSLAYRNRVVEIVRNGEIEWVFDIHGCRNVYGFDMDIGTNGMKNLACDYGSISKMTAIWREEGLDVRVDEKFMAARLETVSNYVHRKTGVNCVQIELSEEVRKCEKKMEGFLRGFEWIFGEVLGGGGGSRADDYRQVMDRCGLH